MTYKVLATVNHKSLRQKNIKQLQIQVATRR